MAEQPDTRLTGELSEADADPDPVRQLQRWYGEAVAAGVYQPDAMTLATATRDGRPSARMVLLKQLDHHGLVFYTSYASRKGRELAANPYAALVLWWGPLARQVRVEGRVGPLTAAESDAYFASRPLGSRLAASASPQSQVLGGRQELLERVEELAAHHPDGPVPRPAWWGGYRLVPEVVEFWQGRPSRLHDRLRYTRSWRGWRVERLAP